MKWKLCIAGTVLLGSFATTTRPLHAQDSEQTAPPPTTIHAYQNYDFVPGETVLFADDFTATQDGEFPNQWELKKGQAVVNKIGGMEALLLTDGNYAQVVPRMKVLNYLGKQWTLEFDTFGTADAYQPVIFLEQQGGSEAKLGFSTSEVAYDCDCNGAGVSLNASYPASSAGDNYMDRWHHIAISVNGSQLKVYVDQARALVVPDTHFQAASLLFAGIGQPEAPITYANVRIGSGSSMNLVGKKFTDAKIVTHAINFDVDRATIRPESMGALNQIKSIMAADPALKFEIDGHTDNSGASAHNQQLSQQRADSVKDQLVSMGVDASRLTTKGYGDSKPIAPNTTPEGKANNRRVEFVRM